jgi:hypothetical protein
MSQLSLSSFDSVLMGKRSFHDVLDLLYVPKGP